MASEHALQVAVAHMLQLVLDPERTWWTAIDHGAGKLSRRAAGMMKARGVKRGLPDFIVMADLTVGLIGIELKTEKGRLTPDQLLIRDAWHRMGHLFFVAHSLEEVQEILEHCHVPMRRRLQLFGRGAAHDRRQRSTAARHLRPSRLRKSKNHLPLVLADEAQKN